MTTNTTNSGRIGSRAAPVTAAVPAILTVAVLLLNSPATGQTFRTPPTDDAYRQSDFTVPQTRLVPIGSPSAVDRYRQNAPPPAQHQPPAAASTTALVSAPTTSAVATNTNPTNTNPTTVPTATFGGVYPHAEPAAPVVRQVVLMQPQLPAPPAGQMAAPPISQSPGGGLPAVGGGLPAVGGQPMTGGPPQQAPPAIGGTGLTPVPRAPAGANPSPSTGYPAANNDLTPLAQPQLGNQYANLGNCRNVSAPSSYRSDRILTCGPPAGYVVPASNPQTYVPPPAQIGTTTGLVPPPLAVMPSATQQTVIPGNAGYRPLISFGQERYPVQVGQGIFGQPVAYVPGQSFRNALRYIAW